MDYQTLIGVVSSSMHWLPTWPVLPSSSTYICPPYTGGSALRRITAMFGTNLVLPSHRMLSYSSALKKYQSIQPIRGRQDQNTRPLAQRRNDNLTIRQDPATNDIIVRLYSTDIITYSAVGDGDNNLIHLDPYPSVLTNRIMWSILGPHVNTHWSDRPHPVPNHITEVNGRYYNTPSFVTVQPHQAGWIVTAGAEPIEVPRLNRKEAKQALRDANYYTFEVWLRTQLRLGSRQLLGDAWRSRPFDWTPSTAVQYLREGETGWAEISRRFSARATLDRELGSLRRAVYQYDLCYDVETVDYFEGYTEMKNAFGRIRANS